MAGIYAYASGSSIQMSNKTYGQLKAIVARVVGAQAQPDSVGAGDAIHMAIDKLNEYEWEYLTVWGADQVPVAEAHGASTSSVVTCPTNIKKVLSLRWNGKPLGFARRGDWDKTALQDAVGSEPTHYTWFNTAMGGIIELLPPGTGQSGTVQLKLYRPILKPTANEEQIDIQQWMERFLILEAQTQMALEHGDDMAKVDRLQSRADKALQGILGSDRAPGPQEDAGFVPYTVWGNSNLGYPIDHAWPYVLEGDAD